MPLVCTSLPPETMYSFYRKILALPRDNTLLRDCMKGDVIVERIDNIILFRSKSNGFYFERCAPDADLETAIEHAITTPREYHCSAFIVDADDPTVVDKLLVRFQEQYGAKLAAKIDHVVLPFEGKLIMHTKFPSCVLRHMMASSGGVMKTGFSGSVAALRNIPTLARMCSFSETETDNDTVKSVVATEYPAQYYIPVQGLHWDIVREVLARPHAGICLGPVAQWDT